jgi:hypothetical protein
VLAIGYTLLRYGALAGAGEALRVEELARAGELVWSLTVV